MTAMVYTGGAAVNSLISRMNSLDVSNLWGVRLDGGAGGRGHGGSHGCTATWGVMLAGHVPGAIVLT